MRVSGLVTSGLLGLVLVTAGVPVAAQSPSVMPSPSVAPSLSAVPVPVIGPDALGPAPSPPVGPEWTRTLDVSFTSSWATMLVACEDGFTLVADGRDWRGRPGTRVWTSRSGMVWSEEEGFHPALGTDPYWLVTALVPFRGALYALGGEDRRLMVWRSPDCGRSWKRVNDPTFALGRRAFALSLGVQAAATGDRMVVIGRQGGEEIPPRTWAWTLDPGGVWRRIPGGLSDILELSADGDGFAAQRDTHTGPASNDAELVTSADGVTWSGVALMPSDSVPVPDPVRGGYWVATDEGIMDPRVPTIWRSADGTAWTPIARGLPTDQCCGVIAAGDGLLVWTVDGGTIEPDVTWSWIGVSDDGGATWSVSAGWPGLDIQGARSIVITPDEIVIAGGGLDRVQAWRLPR